MLVYVGLKVLSVERQIHTFHMELFSLLLVCTYIYIYSTEYDFCTKEDLTVSQEGSLWSLSLPVFF